MDRLRAELQRHGMSPANAEEAAGILARLGGMEGKLDRLRADMRDILATADRILARMAAAEDRRPRA